MIVQHAIRDISLYKTDMSDSAVFGWKDILLTPTEREELGCLYDQLWQQDNSNLIVSQGTAQAQSSVPASYLQVGGQFNSEPQPPIPVDTSFGYCYPYTPTLPQSQPNMPGLGNEDLAMPWEMSHLYHSPDYGFPQGTGSYSFGSRQNEPRPLSQTSNYITPSFSSSIPVPFASNPVLGYPTSMHSVHPIGPSPLSPQIASNDHHRSSYPTRSNNRPDDTALALKQSQPFQIFVRFLEGKRLEDPRSLVNSPLTASRFWKPRITFGCFLN
ncbi:hypothetical protein F5X99DRAFT_46732 [Biscogniauxia marginata]|nr:hypothetical protein F5X99DRAFT_46732 [Biscogniauxia marginata]